MIAEGWLIVYMDDMLITSRNKEEDIEKTRRVLQRMKELDLHLKPKKCQFGVEEVDFLGLVLRPGEIAMDPTKLSGIAEWPTPTKVKDVRSFLGFANYYRRFIRDYSNIVRPLIDLTKKEKQWNWSTSCQTAFDRIKEEFAKEPVLTLPNLNKPFTIATDSSSSKQTQMENGTRAHISPNRSPPQNETTTSTTGNSSPSSEDSRPGNTTCGDRHSL